MLKGFTTVKFFIGCSLALIALYNSFLLTCWCFLEEEESSLKKLVSFLMILIAIALIHVLDSKRHFLNFIRGGNL